MNINWPVEKWEQLRDFIADVSCWHMGFSAANTDHMPPPGLRDLETLATEINHLIRKDKGQ